MPVCSITCILPVLHLNHVDTTFRPARNSCKPKRGPLPIRAVAARRKLTSSRSFLLVVTERDGGSSPAPAGADTYSAPKLAWEHTWHGHRHGWVRLAT